MSILSTVITFHYMSTYPSWVCWNVSLTVVCRYPDVVIEIELEVSHSKAVGFQLEAVVVVVGCG
jgi:hypothetical protein